MKLYMEDDPAPNPRRVRLFLAEKGLSVAEVRLPLRHGAHKSPEHLARNPLGQVPTLELDDGTCLSETISICRYLEALHPASPLFGEGGEDQRGGEAHGWAPSRGAPGRDRRWKGPSV